MIIGNAFSPAIQLDMAIVFPALAWGLGFRIVDERMRAFAPLAIKCSLLGLVGYTF